MRARIRSYLDLSFAAAKYAGVNKMPINNIIDTMYFIINKMFIPINIYIPYFAFGPNSSAMRINWLYFAILSVRDIEPVLI